jgi:hypothetical protein
VRHVLSIVATFLVTFFIAADDRPTAKPGGGASQEISRSWRGAGTGGGVDSIAYSPATHELFAGAARTGQLTVVNVDATGHLTAAAQVTTAPGARNGVLAGSTVYLAHSLGNELIAVSKK